MARPQRTEEKRIACALGEPDFNLVDTFGVHKVCRMGVAQLHSAESGVHKWHTKAAERVLERPFRQEGGVWARLKFIHQSGRKHV